MFTGIVKQIGTISQVKRFPALMRYAVRLPPEFLSGLEVGASVSIDGVCQTVVAIQDTDVFFEAIEETLQRTTLSHVQPGSLVHVERSARIGEEVGGHLLSGHVFGMVEIQEFIQQGHLHILRLACNPNWMKYVFVKGYVALDGCSLTVVDVDINGLFCVHLIPETIFRTNFINKIQGSLINIEFDTITQLVVDTIERFNR